MTHDNNTGFQEIKNRLDEIVNQVSEEDLALDEALSLYEEAIDLGMQVSSLLEENLSPEETDEALNELAELEQQDAGIDSAKLDEGSAESELAMLEEKAVISDLVELEQQVDEGSAAERSMDGGQVHD